jgi:hypothetical protein
MVGDAEAALGSLTWERGLQAITQHGLQALLWHELPRKWLTDRKASCTSPLCWGGCWSWSGCPLGGDLPSAPDRRGAAGLRGRRPGGLPGVPPGAGALRGGAAGPARAAAVVRLGAGDGRREADAFVSVAAALELAVAAASCARRRGLVRGPAGGRPPAPGGCRAGAGWAELAGGGGGGPSGAVRGRAAVVRPGGRWSTGASAVGRQAAAAGSGPDRRGPWPLRSAVAMASPARRAHRHAAS